MDYFLDGYNLAHWLAGERDLDPAGLRRLLEAALKVSLPHDARSIHIYWDVRRPNPSVPDRQHLGWCTAHNVPDADEAILDAVWAATEPRRVVVVSRDREVLGKSRQLGARVLSPAELLGRP